MSVFDVNLPAGNRQYPADAYKLGHRPEWRFALNGQLFMTSHKQGLESIDQNRGEYSGALFRADVELAYSKVPTATIDLVGKDTALFLEENVNRGDQLTIAALYADQQGEFNRPRLLFSGDVIEASMESFDPLRVQLKCDGPSYKMREDRDSESTEDQLDVEFIRARLQGLGLDVNFRTEEALGSGDIARTTGTESFLDSFNNWTKSYGLHWYDLMDGNIAVVFPGSSRDEAMNWSIPLLGGQEYRGTYEAPIIDSWGVKVSHVDIPGKVEAPWRKPHSIALEQEMVKSTIPDGIPERVYTLPPIVAATKPRASEILRRIASNYSWRTVMGPFGLKVGIPMMPFDNLVVTNGPRGIQGIYDRQLRIIETHHIMDSRGWQTKGAVRAVVDE